MAIINDIDLLLIEPSLFTDAADAAVELIASDDGNISGSQLNSGQVDFEDAGVTAGQVVVVNGEPLEVVDRLGKTELSVSARRLPGSPVIDPGNGTGLMFSVLTFARHVEDAERWLARALGLDQNHPTTPLSEENVLNYDELADLVSYRVTATAFAQAAAADPADDSLRDRAELYERMAVEVRQLATALIDIDGDGVADEQRRLAVGTWVRM